MKVENQMFSEQVLAGPFLTIGHTFNNGIWIKRALLDASLSIILVHMKLWLPVMIARFLDLAKFFLADRGKVKGSSWAF